MSDIRLATATDGSNPIIHDLHLDETGQISLVDGLDAIAQHLKIRLQFFLGEWFLDQNEGMPYRQTVFAKGTDVLVVRDVLRRAILGTPGIIELLSLTYSLSRATRELTATFSAQTDTGEILDSTEFGPFVVEL